MVLSQLRSMRDEMSKIAEAKHTAKHAFAQPISTKPVSTAVSTTLSKNGKLAGTGTAPSKNAGAPKGFRGPRKPSTLQGQRADPLNPSPVTNA